MTESEFLSANNLFAIRLMKSILATIIPNETITEKDQSDLKVLLHKWEHNSHKSFDVEEENIVEEGVLINLEQDNFITT